MASYKTRGGSLYFCGLAHTYVVCKFATTSPFYTPLLQTEAPCEKRKKKQAPQGWNWRTIMIEAEMHFVLQTAEVLYAKRKKKEAPQGWESFNQRTLYRAYERRTANVDVDLEVCIGLRIRTGTEPFSSLLCGHAMPWN